VVDDACRRVPLTRDLVGDDGLIADVGVPTELRAALDALL
jgi:hypothetical protein